MCLLTAEPIHVTDTPSHCKLLCNFWCLLYWQQNPHQSVWQHYRRYVTPQTVNLFNSKVLSTWVCCIMYQTAEPTSVVRWHSRRCVTPQTVNFLNVLFTFVYCKTYWTAEPTSVMRWHSKCFHYTGLSQNPYHSFPPVANPQDKLFNRHTHSVVSYWLSQFRVWTISKSRAVLDVNHVMWSHPLRRMCFCHAMRARERG